MLAPWFVDEITVGQTGEQVGKSFAGAKHSGFPVI